MVLIASKWCRKMIGLINYLRAKEVRKKIDMELEQSTKLKKETHLNHPPPCSISSRSLLQGTILDQMMEVSKVVSPRLKKPTCWCFSPKQKETEQRIDFILGTCIFHRFWQPQCKERSKMCGYHVIRGRLLFWTPGVKDLLKLTINSHGDNCLFVNLFREIYSGVNFDKL